MALEKFNQLTRKSAESSEGLPEKQKDITEEENHLSATCNRRKATLLQRKNRQPPVLPQPDEHAPPVLHEHQEREILDEQGDLDRLWPQLNRAWLSQATTQQYRRPEPKWLPKEVVVDLRSSKSCRSSTMSGMSSNS